MELKFEFPYQPFDVSYTFNRTAYGIEITFFSKIGKSVIPFNRTAYGIEIIEHTKWFPFYLLLIAPLMELKYEIVVLLHHLIQTFNRTAYGIEMVNTVFKDEKINLLIAPLMELK